MSSSERRAVVVIGGGPAGTAAAIELARARADVLLLERRAFPRAKVCGGCLGPRAIACLQHLGIDAAMLAGAVPLERVRIAMAGAAAELPLPAGVAVDRATLDLHLLERARIAGAEVRTEARARIGDDVGDGREVLVETDTGPRHVIAGIVVLATGLPPVPTTVPGARVGLSQMRRVAVPAAESRPGSDRTSAKAAWSSGSGAGRSPGPAEGEVQMVVGAAGYVGMVRFTGGRLNVAASVHASTLGTRRPGELVDEILVAAALPALQWHDGWTGTPPLRARASRAVDDRVLPVGDAAGFWEPFTGEGIGWGLEAGIAVAPAARELAGVWDPARAAAWSRQRRAWMHRVQVRSRTVAALSGHPRLARLALGLVDRVPAAGRWLIPAVAPVLDPSGQAPGAMSGAA